MPALGVTTTERAQPTLNPAPQVQTVIQVKVAEILGPPAPGKEPKRKSQRPALLKLSEHHHQFVQPDYFCLVCHKSPEDCSCRTPRLPLVVRGMACPKCLGIFDAPIRQDFDCPKCGLELRVEPVTEPEEKEQ